MFSLNSIAAISIEKDLKIACYKRLAKVQEKYPNAVRGLGVFVGVGSFLATVIARVVAAVEAPLKSLVKIFIDVGHLRGKSALDNLVVLLGRLTIVNVAHLCAITLSAVGIFQKTFDLAVGDLIISASERQKTDLLSYACRNYHPPTFFEKMALKAEADRNKVY